MAICYSLCSLPSEPHSPQKGLFSSEIKGLARQDGVKNGRISASDAGWSSLAARRAHNPKVVGSNPAPATKQVEGF